MPVQQGTVTPGALPPAVGAFSPPFPEARMRCPCQGPRMPREQAGVPPSAWKAQSSSGGGGGVAAPAPGRPSSVQSQPRAPDTEGHRSDTTALGFPGLAPATVTGPARKLPLTPGKGREWGGQDETSLSSEQARVRGQL